jgi:hypothetical protein
MENLTPTQKRNLLAELVYLQSVCGYDVASVMGYPLSRFNFDKVKSTIDELIKEWEYSNDCPYYPHYI